MRAPLWPLFLALSLFSSVGSAASGKAAAIAAFDEGRKLLAGGHVQAACDKYAESYALDPQVGALLHFADCQEQLGKLASAWSAFRDAADIAAQRGDGRAELARERALVLEPRLSTLQVLRPDGAPPDVVVYFDGVQLLGSSAFVPNPVDGGRHVIRVEAPGFRPVETHATVKAERTAVRVTLPRLQPISSSDGTPDSGTVAASGRSSRRSGAPSADTAAPSLLAQKWPALAAAGVALVGGGVWGVFGVQSMEAKAAADGKCGSASRVCFVDGVEQRDRAFQSGSVATAGIVATGIGAAAAVALWIVLPLELGGQATSKSQQALTVSLQPHSIQLSGRF